MVSSQTVVEYSPEVSAVHCAVHCLELVIIRVAAGGVQSRGEREGKKDGRGKKGERVQERRRRAGTSYA